MGDFNDGRQNTFMCNLMKANPQYFGNVMTKHVGHEDISVLALTHVHGVGNFNEDIKVGIKQF